MRRRLFTIISSFCLMAVTISSPNTYATAAGLKEFEATVIKMSNVPVLIDVPGIMVDTVVGTLPHLPYTIPGVYRDGVQGPLVRVNWPAPTDNSQVLKPGIYTLTGAVPGTDFKPVATIRVKDGIVEEKPRMTLEAFSLGSINLDKDENGNDIQFVKNRNKFINGLLNLPNPDRFLYVFRDAFNEEQKGPPLGGWDASEIKLRGHATGHYLSALAQAYAGATYDASMRDHLKQKMDYMVDELDKMSRKSGRPVKEGDEYNADPQKIPVGPGKSDYDSDFVNMRHDYWNWGEGYISGYPPDQFIMLEKGARYSGSKEGIWAPYYTLHKILAGLLDCYQVGGNEKALAIAEGMGLWVYRRLKDIPEETLIDMWKRYIAGEYGGMNEVMARLYAITGDERYLITARLFDNITVFYGDARRTHGLAKNVDTIRKLHANQHIPQITGVLKTYDVTGDNHYYDIAANFWDMVYNSYMYSIGGVAGDKDNAECFTAQPNTLFTNGFNTSGQNETCATYNLLKLSRQLFMHDQDGKYMDYYEQALYNDILASVAEVNAANTYHIPLNPGAQKKFDNENMDGFSCCNGTALESNTKFQESIYFRSKDNKALYVNLYLPSTLNWKARNIVIKQVTHYPYADTTKLTITDGGGDFDLKVRVPKWAIKGFFVKINGQEQSIQATPGTYLTLKRTWNKGDIIELKMPFHFYLNRVMDQPNMASIFYGPVLLAVEEFGTLSTWRKVDLNAEDIGRSIIGEPSTLRFNITNSANADYNNDGIINDKDQANLKPFWEVYQRHSVYLDVNLQD